MTGPYVRRAAGLPPEALLSPAERAFFTAPGPAPSLPFRATRHYLSLIDWSDPEDPIRRQCIPRGEEHRRLPFELDDPLGEDRAAAGPRLIHRYADRALLLVTDRCAVYCRHCFRRRFSGGGRRAISPGEAAGAADYLRSRPEIRELILSGGDPFTLPDRRLCALMARFRAHDAELAFRIHTRLPVVLPRRFGAATLERLAAFRPLRLVTHFNHPRELGPQAIRLAAALAVRGIPLLNQAVLLRGVNDDAETLAALIRGLVAAGIRPYYLFQGDLAPGTGHLRVPLERGLRLMEEVKRESGLPPTLLPLYALDQPGLGGKVPLTFGSILAKADGFYVLSGRGGRTFTYPVES